MIAYRLHYTVDIRLNENEASVKPHKISLFSKTKNLIYLHSYRRKNSSLRVFGRLNNCKG